MTQTKVSVKRHLAKTITWRIIGTIDTIIISWLITGKLSLGLTIGGIEIITKMVLYYSHERAWYKWIKFGLTENIIIKKPKKINDTPQIIDVQPEEPKIKRLTYTKKTN
jgi:uncharacterized membrane protein